MQPAKFFSTEQKEEIQQAVREAELNTSGEIRVHIEKHCKGDVLDRSAYIFERLHIHRTSQRNGVLFYLAIDDHKFAILGDAGINAITPDDFWDQIKNNMLVSFKDGRFTEGLVTGIEGAGKQLKEHFPYQQDDVNELPDEISFGEK